MLNLSHSSYDASSPSPSLKRKERASDRDSPSPSTPSPSKRARMRDILPSHLQPIPVPPPTPLVCPMPGCSTELDAKDSAWRAHFSRVHADDLCSTDPRSECAPGLARCPHPDCQSPSSPSARPRKSNSGDANGVEMTPASVGRHWLNVHIGLVFRCPACGLEGKWRESACARHVRNCVKRQEGARRGKGGSGAR